MRFPATGKQSAVLEHPGIADEGPVPISFVGLSKRYGESVLAVDALSFSVGRGQVFGLLGPNGAGKTTALRILLGLVHPTAGEARIFGERVTSGTKVLRRVGALVEGPAFVPHLSGLANLRVFWEAGGQDIREANLDSALELAGLGKAIDRKVRTYSKGMQQRLGLAQALLNKPDLLVLDEPTVGLDPQEMREIRQLVRDVADAGATVLLSSHILAEVEQVCTNAAVMDRGRLVAMGSVAELTSSASSVYIEVDDLDRAVRFLRSLPGIEALEMEAPGLSLRLDGIERKSLVAALVGEGIGVETVTSRHRLEDAFFQMLEGDT
jgi:ABC-2 type transport system ATP-binding protein